MQYDATGERKISGHGHEAQMSEQQMLDTARGENLVRPMPLDVIKVMLRHRPWCRPSATFARSVQRCRSTRSLGTYYQKNFKSLGQTTSGQWAAMFGLLNVVTRPLGGLVADLLYMRYSNVWIKKIWMNTPGVTTGVFLIVIGFLDSHDTNTMFGLIAGMAFFLEAGSGANFAMVPHVLPHSNGVVSGMTAPNWKLWWHHLRYHIQIPRLYKAFWIIGVITIGLNLAVSWIPPMSKKQVGGR